jgi:hypothetical protein
VPHDGFDFAPVIASAAGYGLTVGLDQAGLARASASAADFSAHYAKQSADVNRQILEFVVDAGRYFGLSGISP